MRIRACTSQAVAIKMPHVLTREYYGYLMAEHSTGSYQTMYACINKDMETIPGNAGNTNGAHLYHVDAMALPVVHTVIAKSSIVLCAARDFNYYLLILGYARVCRESESRI